MEVWCGLGWFGVFQWTLKYSSVQGLMFLLFFIFQWDVSLSVSLNRMNEKTEAEIYLMRE